MPRAGLYDFVVSILTDSTPSLITAAYGFGSYPDNSDATDIDLLLVMDNVAPIKASEALTQIKIFRERFHGLTGERPDITNLTEKECLQTGFIQLVGGQLLWKATAKVG